MAKKPEFDGFQIEAPEVSTVEEPKKDVKRYGIFAQKIDRFNTKKTRVLITPAVCPKCRLDLAKLNKLGDYHKLDADVQAKLRGAVEKHIENVHDISEQDILTEDQLPTQYLGPVKEIRAS